MRNAAQGSLHRLPTEETILGISPKRRVRDGWLSVLAVLSPDDLSRRKEGREGESIRRDHVSTRNEIGN
jgi:hypothetical protein